jgi:hypothetical protein
MATLQVNSSPTSPEPSDRADPHIPASVDEDDEFIFASIDLDRFTDKTRLGVRDDKTQVVRSEYQIGQAAMHVVSLDPHWRVSGKVVN